MNVTFTTLEIEGFQSIGPEVTIDLESQGFVMIKGINNYEEKAASNGSGKSSLIEALTWCLFGKTSSGVSNVKNRYYPNGCHVSVHFSKNSEHYIISRSLDHKKYKSQVSVQCNSNTGEWNDLSCRNKSDTDKLIKDSILPFNQDIFLSTIFLSQGFSGRLSLLTPSARKERLEILANIDESISQFKDQMSDIKSSFNVKCTDIQKKLSYTQGQLDLYSSEKDTIEELKGKPDTSIPDIPIEAMETKLANLNDKITEIADEYNNLSSKTSEFTSKVNTCKERISRYKNEVNALDSKLNALEKESKCPTCHQIINKDINQTLTAQFLNERQQFLEALDKHAKLETACTTELKALNIKATSIKEKYQLLKDMRTKTEAVIQDYYTAVKKNSDVAAKISRLSECTSKISELSEAITKLEKQYTKISKQYDISDHILKMITKEFRSYLLTDIVNQINNRLAEYSRELFENSEDDTIRLSTDDTKLNILLGSSLYETLSGGEKKKVDLALVLAQRDIALRISGFSTNILILDETLENMDEQASNVSLNLLNQVTDEVESLFIISHNNYSIPIDQTITVTKGKDRISKVTIS